MYFDLSLCTKCFWFNWLLIEVLNKKKEEEVLKHFDHGAVHKVNEIFETV